MRKSTAVIALTVAIGFAPAARADSETGDPKRALSGVIGFGTPVGGLGVEGSYRIRPDLELSVGLGLGLAAAISKAMPIQLAVMPRYRIGNPRNALTLGLGMSGGKYGDVLVLGCESQEDFVQCNTHDARYTLWANAEIGGEHVGPSGFTVRYFVGYGRILAQGAHDCTYLNQPTDNCPGPVAANMPYLGVALGQLF